MAEYDNLLARYERLYARLGQTQLESDFAAAVRALQTENTDKTARLDEAEEKLALLGAGCYNATREELIERISAVGPARFKAGDWLADRIDKATEPLRTENTELREKAEQALNMKLSLDLEDGGWYGGVSVRDVINRSERAEQKQHLAERVITEALDALPETRESNAVHKVAIILSSYPLGEGQTPKEGKS